HPNLGRERLVVEDAGQAEVDAHRPQRSGPTGTSARASAKRGKLRGRELIPVVLLEIPIEVLQQAVVNQTAYLRQSHQVRRIGSRQGERCVLRDNRELILANVPLHVRILAGELLREVDDVGEPRLEVALHRHWLRAAGRLERGRGRRRGTRSERGGRALPRPGGHGECREATYRQEDSHLPHRCTPMSRITPVSRHPRCPRRYSRPALLLAVSIVSLR